MGPLHLNTETLTLALQANYHDTGGKQVIKPLHQPFPHNYGKPAYCITIITLLEAALLDKISCTHEFDNHSKGNSKIFKNLR